MDPHPNYLRVLLAFARNSLIRDMTFRGNFIIETISSMSWVFMNLGFYILIFEYTPSIGAGETGWTKYQFFVFLSTTLLINSIVHAFFMTNADEFSELIRTGSLDFVLLKPMDTQFLISFKRVQWSALGNFVFGLCLLGYSLAHIDYTPGPLQVLLYPVYVGCGVALFYSLMLVLASLSVWLGRNQSLYNFWFYITNFSRYPMEIYSDSEAGGAGLSLWALFTFVIPVLLVVNVPARLLVRPLDPKSPEEWFLPVFALFATLGSLAASRWVFNRALLSYRSASS